MYFLEIPDADRVAELCGDCFGGGVGAAHRRDARDAVLDRGGAGRLLVVEGRGAGGRVDRELDVAALQEIDRVGAAFVHLEDGLAGQAGVTEGGGRASRRYQVEAQLGEAFRDLNSGGLVLVVYADEDRSLFGNAGAGADLGFQKGLAEVHADAHHFPCGAHFGAEGRVDAGELVEREDRGFDEVLGDGQLTRAVAVVTQLFAPHQADGDLRERDAGRLADVRD